MKTPLPRAVTLPRGPAPNLRWHMRVRALTYPDVRHVQIEVSELRALLAVARAAKRATYGKINPNDALKRDLAFARALANLERISNEKLK